jgi:hypothetical protein
MNQIIDEIEKMPVVKKTFSKLSFIISIVTVLLYCYVYRLILLEKPDIFEPSSNKFTYAAYAGFLSTIVGFVMAIISFMRKEPSTIVKWIGGVLNIGIFVFYIGRVIFHMW